MTPTGSFSRSNREIWVMIGLSLGMPYLSRTPSITSCGSSRFLSLSGSMEGAIRNCLMGSFRENDGAENTAASYWTTNSFRNLQTFCFGSDRSMWQRQIHLFSARFLHQGDRLGIVDEDDIVGGIHLLQIAPARLHEYLEILFADVGCSAVQGVMEFLRDLEELPPPFDHVPANIQPQFLEQRNHPVEDLRHAAADGRGVDVQYPLSPQMHGDEPQVLHDGFPDDGDIVIDLYHGYRISFSINEVMVRRKSSIV